MLGRRSVTVDTALRIGYYFGTTPEFWINLQTRYDLDLAQRTVRRRIEREIKPNAAGAAIVTPTEADAHRGNPMNHSEIVSFLWGVADLIRDSFKRGKYQDVILPLTVLRRLDCVLGPTKEQVLRRQAELTQRGLQTLHRQLCIASGFEFYNTSRYDFDKLVADRSGAAAHQ